MKVITKIRLGLLLCAASGLKSAQESGVSGYLNTNTLSAAGVAGVLAYQGVLQDYAAPVIRACSNTLQTVAKISLLPAVAAGCERKYAVSVVVTQPKPYSWGHVAFLPLIVSLCCDAWKGSFSYATYTLGALSAIGSLWNAPSTVYYPAVTTLKDSNNTDVSALIIATKQYGHQALRAKESFASTLISNRPTVNLSQVPADILPRIQELFQQEKDNSLETKVKVFIDPFVVAQENQLLHLTVSVEAKDYKRGTSGLLFARPEAVHAIASKTVEFTPSVKLSQAQGDDAAKKTVVITAIWTQLKEVLE